LATRDNTPETIQAGTSARLLCQAAAALWCSLLEAHFVGGARAEQTRISLSEERYIYGVCSLVRGSQCWHYLHFGCCELHTALRAACCRDLYLPCLVSGLCEVACLTRGSREAKCRTRQGLWLAHAAPCCPCSQRQRACCAITLAALSVSHRSGPRQSGSLGCLCAACRWASAPPSKCKKKTLAAIAPA
jgi:hypothetical protein